MFGLGMPEILLILAIALIVIGPKKLPELAKTLGRAMGEFKRSAQDLKRSIDIESTIEEPVPAPSKKVKEIIKEVNADNETGAEDKSAPETEDASSQETKEESAPETEDAPFSDDKPAGSQTGGKEPTKD